MEDTYIVTELKSVLVELNISELEAANYMRQIRSIFTGKDDFSSSLEFFLNLRIGKI